MVERLSGLWTHLQTLPVFWLMLTLAVYQLALQLTKRTHGFPLANPVGLSILVLVLLLYFTGTPYERYFAGGQWIHFLLAPATVALAVPLYLQRERIGRLLVPLLITLTLGSLFAIGLSVGIGWALGASPSTLLTLAPKAATAPVAMGIVEKLGGIPSLTAAVVILTGITGSIAGPWVLDRLGIREPAVRGFALGLASHGIGTARAFQESTETGAFAGLGMGLNALMTAVLVPLLYRLVS
ncbi:LrgB family protein [Propionivibrio soli]|uniref:LrgB family protein n=1 Tax=Propionivibrio soli TaxID=2976531 RepID=UPI0021E98D7F|nr:LrgB family protein [Propionivibrio soli]